jgi:membrane protein involved in colicin uptake
MVSFSGKMPLDEEIEELRKLSPQERIRKLKEIEEKRKKEIEEAETLIRESELEIGEHEEFRRKVPIDEVRATDISTLDTASEDARRIWKTSRHMGLETAAAETSTTSPLERTAEQEAPSEEKREAEQRQAALYQLEKKAEKQAEMYGGAVEQQKPKSEYRRATKAEEEEKAHRDYLK